MDKKIKKYQKVWKISLIVWLIVSILILLLSLVPFETGFTRDNFIYENGVISYSSMKTDFLAIIDMYALLSTLLFVFMCVISFKLGNGIRRAARILLNALVCLFTIFLCFALGGNLDDDPFSIEYSPVFYEFSHNEHKIVICEESFLLGGWGTVYQVYEDNSAYPIGSFSTDDGYRNNGKYELEWDKSGVAVTYDFGSGAENPYDTDYYEFAD